MENPIIRIGKFIEKTGRAAGGSSVPFVYIKTQKTRTKVNDQVRVFW